MKAALIIALMFFAPLVTQANELPEAPISHIAVEQPSLRTPRQVTPTFNKKYYITEMAIVGGSMASDWFTTVHQIYKANSHESNPMLGWHPSELKIAAYGTMEFAAAGTVGWIAEHSHRKVIRWTGRALIAGSAFNHARAAGCNAREINCHDLPLGAF